MQGPEQTVRQLDPDIFIEHIRINTLPTLLLAKSLHANFRHVRPALFATVSARVGSIEDNRPGGWFSYRASKAALNMGLKTLAIEWRRQLSNVAVVALHPGTTDTAPSRPFQRNAPPAQLFTPAQSASYLLDVLDALTPRSPAGCSPSMASRCPGNGDPAVSGRVTGKIACRLTRPVPAGGGTVSPGRPDGPPTARRAGQSLSRSASETADVEKSDLLKELHIDDGARDPATRRTPALVAGLLIVVLAGLGAGYWLFAGKVYTLNTAIAQAPGGVPGSTSVLDATGYVTARRQATVSAKVTGQVTEVLIEEGQRVQADEVLARLDDTDARAQFELAQAQHDAARAQLAGLRVLLAQARRDAARQQDLLARELTSQQAADDARTQVETRTADIVTQQRQVEVAGRAVEVAQVALDNTVIRAPFAGVITVKAAQPGEIVSPLSAGGGYTRTGIGTIVDMDSLEIEVEVNEAYIGRVQAGQPVQTTLNAYPDWKIPGKVIAIIPAADRSKATVKVRIGIDVRDARIVPDMGARVAFLENGTGSNAAGTAAPSGALIPASAIRTQGDGGQVFVLVDGQAQARRVKLGQAYADLRQVLDGIDPGERVILAPPDELQDGDRVQTQTGE